MPINYIPNDPMVTELGIQSINPAAERAVGNSNLVSKTPAPPEGLYGVESEEFVYWQTREAALRALTFWESIDEPLAQWQNGQSVLNFTPIVSNQNSINAFYDRSMGLLFYRYQGPTGQVFLTGSSTDVVAHETGHAILDALRPDLYGSNFSEVSAFHESFGDCLAILTSLSDAVIRDEIIANHRLDQDNFLESWGEYLAAGVATISATHNAAAPRKAFNNFQWDLPGNLPLNGGPGVLINQTHSISQIFTGCFYDVIRSIYDQGVDKTANGLLSAAQSAGRLLAKAVRMAPEQARFFKSVGNAMLMADKDINGGQNENLIKNAFAGHNIQIDAVRMMQPTNVLAGRAPLDRAAAIPQVITRASRRELMSAIGGLEMEQAVRFKMSQQRMPEEKVTFIKHCQKIALDDVSEQLAGVLVVAEEEVMVGEEAGHAAALGAIPNVSNNRAEIHAHVKSMLEHGEVKLSDIKTSDRELHTHAVHNIGGEKILKRERFSCGCRITRNFGAR